MIKILTTIDTYQGIGASPQDTEHHAKKLTDNSVVLIDYKLYKSLDKIPKPNQTYVYIKPEFTFLSHFEALREGFKPVDDLRLFLEQKRNVWLLGGSDLFNEALAYVDELHITQVDGNFNSDEHFPLFGDKFEMANKTPIKKMDGVRYQNQIWQSLSTYSYNTGDSYIGNDIEDRE